jgi:hypothetical protein
MKAAILVLTLVCAASLPAQVLLTDDFSGTSLDTSKWSTILPTGSSSVVQNNGSLTTTGRGILATANQFSTPYVISGAFTMLNDFEHFNIVTRTDLSASSYYERPGILVSFSNDGDEISIQRYTSSSDSPALALASFALTTGQSYSFSITDTGSAVTLAINGADELSAASTFGTGDYIAFYSREFPSTATQIDALAITAIPEPSTFAGMAGLTALICVVVLRRSKLVARART